MIFYQVGLNDFFIIKGKYYGIFKIKSYSYKILYFILWVAEITGYTFIKSINRYKHSLFYIINNKI